jgi:hypothetical protein
MKSFGTSGAHTCTTACRSRTGRRELADYVDDENASPRWDYAAELLSDGLIDVHFDLTPRGRRAHAWFESLM